MLALEVLNQYTAEMRFYGNKINLHNFRNSIFLDSDGQSLLIEIHYQRSFSGGIRFEYEYSQVEIVKPHDFTSYQSFKKKVMEHLQPLKTRE